MGCWNEFTGNFKNLLLSNGFKNTQNLKNIVHSIKKRSFNNRLILTGIIWDFNEKTEESEIISVLQKISAYARIVSKLSKFIYFHMDSSVFSLKICTNNSIESILFLTLEENVKKNSLNLIKKKK